MVSEDFKLKTEKQALFFANRLQKRSKHLRKWAVRNNIHAYRVYGRDIPEIPLDVDVYEDAATGERFLHVAFYQRAYETGEDAERFWLEKMTDAAAKSLSVPRGNIFTKTRKRQRGETSQYEKLRGNTVSFYVREGGSLVKVNVSNYLDTGLFLDHRELRLAIKAEAAGKTVLNLFCYTGAFSVQAAAGGAASVVSVDLSKTYLAWAQENMAKNGFISSGKRGGGRTDGDYDFVCADVMEFLESPYRGERRVWDIIICDPPTFSNSKKNRRDLDIGKDWAALCGRCLNRLSDTGTLYFSSNSKRLGFSPEKITPPPGKKITCTDITEQTTPEDFRGKKPHRCWKITFKPPSQI